MTIALQVIYDQLVSLDPEIRRIALTPVADLDVKIGRSNWDNCLYAVMAKAVVEHRGERFLKRSDQVSWLLRLPQDEVWYYEWDQATNPERLQLRQAIRAFLDKEAKKALIQEIEAMGDPLTTKKAKGLPTTRQKVLVG